MSMHFNETIYSVVSTWINAVDEQAKASIIYQVRIKFWIHKITVWDTVEAALAESLSFSPVHTQKTDIKRVCQSSVQQQRDRKTWHVGVVGELRWHVHLGRKSPRLQSTWTDGFRNVTTLVLSFCALWSFCCTVCCRSLSPSAATWNI